MVNIYLNDQLISIALNTSLHEVLATRGYIKAPIAIALNNQFIPRALWTSTLLKESERLDVIVPMQGG